LPHPVTNEIIALFNRNGNSQYGHEAVTQLQHGLQAAWLAEKAGASAALITASLVHDIGHLLHDLPDDAPDHGIDDRHEILGQRWLESRFGPAVVEPVKLHVDAKRYLCGAQPDYLAILSPPSVQSLMLQGGPMSRSECDLFEQNPFFRDAVELRRWDDLAKDSELMTPSIEYFGKYIDETCGFSAATN
jgi:phosphonate degradation associated HDIG domain protein